MAGEVERKVGDVFNISVTPTVDTSAYADGDCIGGAIHLSDVARRSGRSVILQNILITDLHSQDGAMSLIFFDRNPSNGTYTDNSTLDVNDTDLGYCVGAEAVLASDYIDFSDNSIAYVSGIGQVMTPNATDLYLLIRSDGAPTYNSTSDLTIILGFVRD